MEFFQSLSQFQIAGIILQLALLPILFMTLCRLYWAVQSVQWPKVNGVVVKGLDFSMSQIIDFLYIYEINGTSYKGDKPFFANSFRNFKNRKASELMNAYTKNKQISVYYNPSNPKISTLEPGRMDDVLSVLALLVILFLLAFISYYNPTLLVQLVDNLSIQ